MGVAERREREKEQLRARIIEAASAIVIEEGLDALSMRRIAERIEYSAATIYLYFEDKEDLIRSVVEEGMRRFEAAIAAELEVVGPDASPLEQHAATGRAYAVFALENPAFFRIIFELPATAHLECPVGDPTERRVQRGRVWDEVVSIVRRAIEARQIRLPDANRAALIGWGLVHGLTSLCLSGHLNGDVTSKGEFLDLVEEAMASLYLGWGGVAEEAPAASGRQCCGPGTQAFGSGGVAAETGGDGES